LLVLRTAETAADQGIIPFSEIKPGMTGVGRTVFSGTKIDEFQVEVIGTLQNVAPKRNLILVFYVPFFIGCMYGFLGGGFHEYAKCRKVAALQDSGRRIGATT